MNERLPTDSSKTSIRRAIASANHLSEVFPQGLLWPIEKHVAVAQEAGMDGVEVWSATVPMLQIRMGLVSEKGKQGTTSVHESPRTKQLSQMRRIGDLRDLAIPPLESSARDLAKYGKMLGGVEAVLYRETPANLRESKYFTAKRIQFDPELCTGLGITPSMQPQQAAEAMVEVLTAIGYRGCLDLNHIRRPNHNGEPNPLREWRQTIPVFLQANFIDEIHASVGRTDWPHSTAQASVNEVTALESGEDTDDTEVIAMLRLVADMGWHRSAQNGLVVVETLPSAIKQAHGTPGKMVTTTEMLQTYTKFNRTLEKLFS